MLNRWFFSVQISTTLARASGEKSLSVLGTAKAMGSESGFMSVENNASIVAEIDLRLELMTWLSLTKEGCPIAPAEQMPCSESCSHTNRAPQLILSVVATKGALACSTTYQYPTHPNLVLPSLPYLDFTFFTHSRAISSEVVKCFAAQAARSKLGSFVGVAEYLITAS